jgi:Flp pilus assembly pilin Flp
MKIKIYLLKDILGQTVLEVSLIIAVFVLVIASLISPLRNSIAGLFTKTSTILDTGNIEPVDGNFENTHEYYTATDWNISQGGFSINNGIIANTKTGENRAFTKDFNGTDYSVDIKVAQLQKGDGYGVWFRADPNAPNGVNGYTFQYDPGYGNGEFIIRKWVNGSEKGPFARASATGFDWNNPHNIKVNVVGDTFTAYVDGAPVITGKDTTYTSGTAGIRTWDSTHATFEDYTISESSQPSS